MGEGLIGLAQAPADLLRAVQAIGSGETTAGPVRRPAFAATESIEASHDDRFLAAVEQIPRRFRGHRLATIERHVRRPEAVMETRAAQNDLLSGEALAITFVGQSQAGKTSLACALFAGLAELASEGAPAARRLMWSALWTDALALSRSRASHRLGDGEAPLVERAEAASILFLDELGGETVAGSDEVLDVIWRRWQDERPTVVTTGQPPQKLRDRYGDGILTRLTRQSASRLIRCAAPEKEVS